MTDSEETTRLTGKQRLFLQAYLKCFNATEAARQAGYSGNDNTLSQIGFKMVRNGKIKKAIEDFYEENCMEAKEVAWRLARIARADMGDYTNVTKPSDLNNPDIDSYPVHKIETTGRRNKDGTVTVKTKLELHNQVKALEDIAKIHNMFGGDADGSEGKPFVVKFISGASTDDL